MDECEVYENSLIYLSFYAKSFDNHFARMCVDHAYTFPSVGDKVQVRFIHDDDYYYGNVVERVFTYDDPASELTEVHLRLENIVVLNKNPKLSEAEKAIAQEIADEVARRKSHG